MTLQDVFDQTLQHLMAQGCRAHRLPDEPHDDGTSRCRYRTATGLRCAVGYWIPDAAYRPSMEGRSCDHRFVRDALPPALRTDEMIKLLKELQYLHDDLASWSSDRAGLSDKGYLHANCIAAAFGLTGVAR